MKALTASIAHRRIAGALSALAVAGCAACGTDAGGQVDAAARTGSASTKNASTALAGTEQDLRTNDQNASGSERSINGGAGVDGGGEGESVSKRLGDYTDIISVGAAMSSLNVKWLSGVRFDLPKPSGSAVEVQRLSITIGNDPTKGVGDEDNPEPGTSEVVKLALPPNTRRFPVTLQRLSGPESIVTTLHGGRAPSITVIGLPANTVEVQFLSATSAGAKLIRAKSDCSKAPKRQRPRVSGAYSDGERFKVALPASTYAICNGRMRQL